jgi:hypothetical protein
MIEFVILVMQTLCAGVMIGGAVLTLVYLAPPASSAAKSAARARFSYNTANDFEIDFRRVLAFSRLSARR